MESAGDPGVWAAVADAIVEAMRGTEPSGWAVVVAHAAVAPALREALRRRCAADGRPWVPPPIRTPQQWLDALAPAAAIEPGVRVLDAMAALEAAAPQAAARRAPADRLAYADGVLQVVDATRRALALGLIDGAASAEAGLGRGYVGAAAETHLQADLSLLRQLANALGDGAPSPAEIEATRLQRVARHWAAGAAGVAWIDWQPPGPAEAALRRAFEAAAPAGCWLRVGPDPATLAARAPVLAAAWPECFGLPLLPLPRRRAAALEAPSPAGPLVLHAHDREQEALLAAHWVHARLREARAAGNDAPRLVIVALDRWLARRVRALLERAAVLVDDREGWLLSTTVAAHAVIGWLDAVRSDGYWDDLLGWLDSRFVQPPGGRALAGWIERQAAEAGWLRGWSALAADDDGSAPEALAALCRLAAQQGARQGLAAHLATLVAVLAWAGATGPLAQDEAGRQVLALLQGLRRDAARVAQAAPMSCAEFRAWLAVLLERRRFHGAIDSPVVMCGLADAAARAPESVLVLGAAQGLLPSAPPPLPLLTDASRAALGLPTAAAFGAAQQRDLVLLLASAASAAITCRTDAADGTRPGPWVERLHDVAGDGGPLGERDDRCGVVRPLSGEPVPRRETALGTMPVRIAVSGVERLVSCPFRFLVHDGWRLREPAQPADVPGARERGDLVHAVLARFHALVAERGLPLDFDHRPALRDLLVAVTDDADHGRGAGGAVLGEAAEWRAALDGYLDWAIGDAAAGWRWLEAEADASLQVLPPDDEGRGGVRVDGRLDRVDVGPVGLRVIDYKLGDPARLKAIARDPSRAAQLALYAWMREGDAPVATSGYLSVRRDATGWLPLAGPLDAAVGLWRERLPDALRRIRAGVPLAAIGGDCGHCAARGVCRKDLAA
jgi:ATP-dependent helicase/nuclease subunit B